MPRIPLAVPAPRSLAPGAEPPAPSLYGHVPAIQQGARALDVGISAAEGISPQLRRLMNVRVASIVGCPF